jgi:hypothetical protein
MSNFTSDIDRTAAGNSPDRVDALVWAFSEFAGRADERRRYIRVVPPGRRSRRAAQAITCSKRTPAWLNGVVRGAEEEGLNHQVVSFKSPPIPPQCPECCGNPRLLCRGTRSSNPSPSSRQSVSLQISPSFLERPGFCASVERRPGGMVGRDAQGPATSRRAAVVSLSGDISVPQCRRCGSRQWGTPPSAVGPLGIQQYR